MFLWFSYGFPMVFQRITGTTRADQLDQSLVARSLTEARPASWEIPVITASLVEELMFQALFRNQWDIYR